MSKLHQLIAIETNSINGETVQTVNARDLHAFLESKQEFANWIKDRIQQYGFIEHQDFLINLSKTPNGGRPAKEYHISLDMAKELSMV
ncbi:antA/AntB antirepressor family protein [Arsenophonus endosymbiont of Crataerina pallida]